MTPSNDYVYDVFFSYKRHDRTVDWTRKFQSCLQYWLNQEIGRQSKMFVDIDTIEIGDKWPEKLKQGLMLSRCMVGVWSPMYFQSSWCVSEWQSFKQRERIVDSGSLIAPIRFHDGELFPDEARQTQSLDLHLFASTLPAFWNSPRSLELEDRVKELAKAVSEIIKRAPQFRQDWPVLERPGHAPLTIPLSRL